VALFISYVFVYLCLFLCWCRSPAFFYSAGISTGMIASLIVLVFIVARLLPKKSPFYVLLVGGWSFSLYLIQLVFRNLQHLIKQHWQYVTGQLLIALSLEGIADTLQNVEYRGRQNLCGNERSFSCGSPLSNFEVLCDHPCGICGVGTDSLKSNAGCETQRDIVLWFSKLRRWTAKPEPPRLLTEEEYRKQGEVETQRALEELREYCNSPDFSAWRAISRIGSPKR
ncbi:NMP1B protein, partial [Polyodon spathula]|nr:NMP1B protein [Polyodon spathula]